MRFLQYETGNFQWNKVNYKMDINVNLKFIFKYDYQSHWFSCFYSTCPKTHTFSIPFHDMPTKKCQSSTLRVQPFHGKEEVLVYHLEGVARFKG